MLRIVGRNVVVVVDAVDHNRFVTVVYEVKFYILACVAGIAHVSKPEEQSDTDNCTNCF